MNRILRVNIIDITGILVIAFALFLISFGSGFKISPDFPPSLLNLNTIFLSILIEALPFVLIGVLIAGIVRIKRIRGRSNVPARGLFRSTSVRVDRSGRFRKNSSIHWR